MIKNIIIVFLSVTTIAMTLFAWTENQEADATHQLAIENQARVEECLKEANHQRTIAEHTAYMLKTAQDTIRHQHQLILAARGKR